MFSTGFTADLSWLKVSVVEAGSTPVHTEGRSPVDGLWFLGYPWLRTRKSAIVWGAVPDSAHVADQVVERTRARP